MPSTDGIEPRFQSGDRVGVRTAYTLDMCGPRFTFAASPALSSGYAVYSITRKNALTRDRVCLGSRSIACVSGKPTSGPGMEVR
jgi:hypothetical protein